MSYLSDKPIAVLGGGVVVGDTMLDIGLSNVKPVIHIPATTLGVLSVGNWFLVYGNEPVSYFMYSHRRYPSIACVQY